MKRLRLLDARRLMIFDGLAPAAACNRVGNLSLSQFSREYARLFGSAPTKDIADLRTQGIGNDVSLGSA
jgi:AraC-like DNA-binding protein